MSTKNMSRVRFPPLLDALLLRSVMSRRIGTGPTFVATEFDVELLLDTRRVVHDRGEGLRMRLIVITNAVLAASMLLSCDSSSR